ncbi:MAG: acetyltransferase [bacterium]|nr:acetyltransferase [bacterium]
MQKEVIIIGAGGHAKVIAEIILKSGDKVVGFLDDNLELQNKNIYLDKKVIGTTSDIEKFKKNYFIIGIGNNAIRRKINENNKLKLYTAIHPSAIIASDVKISEGTVIMPGVVINPGTKIGANCIINTSSSLDHDNVIEDYVHISPGAHLAGTVTVKENTWLCTGVIVKNNIIIEKNNIIGAGSVVIKDILETNNTYVGVPAKVLKKSR